MQNLPERTLSIFKGYFSPQAILSLKGGMWEAWGLSPFAYYTNINYYYAKIDCKNGAFFTKKKELKWWGLFVDGVLNGANNVSLCHKIAFCHFQMI